MYTCIECNELMLKNTFVCNSCEMNKRRNLKSEKSNNRLVTEQHARVVNMSQGSQENDGSQYWDHTDRHSVYNEDGEAMEVDRANPDYVSATRLHQMELAKEPPVNETRERAIELLNTGAKTLAKREQEAVRDFGNGKTQKETAKKLGITQGAVAQALKRGLIKLQKFATENPL